MMKFSIKVDNEKAAAVLLHKIDRAVMVTMKETGENIAFTAKTFASDAPHLAASIEFKSDAEGFTVSAGDGMETPAIAAYREFGTGVYAARVVPKLPKWWQELAQKYFINGLGRLPAQPYLYPSFKRHTQGITDKIAEKIK